MSASSAAPTPKLSIASPLPAPTCVPPPAGLVSWWPGEGNANDIFGSNNGTLVNGTTFAAGKVGQAFSLDGATDYVQVPNHSALEPATAITVDFWFNASSPGANAYLLSKGQQGCSFASYSFNRVGGSGGLFFDVHTANNLLARSPESANTIFDGTWHHVAGTYNDSTVRLFVDGVEQGSGTAASGNLVYGLSTNNDLVIGRYDPGNTCGADVYNYDGLIDEIEIFNRALSVFDHRQCLLAGQDLQHRDRRVECAGSAAGQQFGSGRDHHQSVIRR